MTKVELTRDTLLAIAGFTSLAAKQLAGKHALKKDLRISPDRMVFLANRLSKILRDAGTNKSVRATTLRADGFTVADCIALMVKKVFDVDLKPEQIQELITEARKQL